MPKQHNAFALKDFDAKKIFDFAAWYKSAHEGLTPELRTSAAEAVNRAENFHNLIVRHLMRLIRLKALIASRITCADNEALHKIKNQISRADELKAAYENINSQALAVKRELEAMLDDIAAIERRDVKNIFKERLAMLRKSRKLSQVKMAEQLGLKRSTYTAYEAGTNEPTISVLVKLVKFSKKPADWFLGL